MKLHEHEMKVVESTLQFGFLPQRRTIDAAFMLRRLQEEHRAK